MADDGDLLRAAVAELVARQQAGVALVVADVAQELTHAGPVDDQHPIVVIHIAGRIDGLEQQRGGVDLVQVQVDGGPWRDAEMGPDVNNDYWRQWFFRWDAEPGSHAIAARAISGDGTTQTAVRAQPFPDGASGIQSLMVTVE